MISFPRAISILEAPSIVGLSEFTPESVSGLLAANEFAPGALAMLFALLPYEIYYHADLLRLGLLHPSGSKEDWSSLLRSPSRRQVYAAFSDEQKGAFPEGVQRTMRLYDLLPQSAWENSPTYLHLAFDMDEKTLETFTTLVAEFSFDIEDPGALFRSLRDATLVLVT